MTLSLTAQLIVVFLLHQCLAQVIEVCPFKKFNASCGSRPDHLVLMTSAEYLRLEGSKCIQDSVGLGCRADVLHLADGLCSGRVHCVFDIPRSDFDKYASTIQGCSSAYKMYLHAKYECLQVDPMNSCTSSQPSGYLSSSLGRDHCASNWTLHQQPGQRINLTLYDFGTSKHTQHTGHSYAVVTEHIDGANVRTNIFGGTQRIRQVYMSRGNSVSIKFIPGTTHFLLHYQVVGCADLMPPEGGWIQKVTETTMKMGCNHRHQVSTLQCVNNEWQGQQLNCTHIGESSDDNVPIGRSFTNVLVIAIILGVAVFICTTIVIIGICCFRSPTNNRGRQRLPTAYDVTYDPAADQMIDHIKLTSPNEEFSGKCLVHNVPKHSPRPFHHHHSNTMRPTKQQYEQIWEQQRSRTLHMKNTL